MAAAIHLMASDFDPLRVDRVFVNASGDLRAVVSGVECRLATKEIFIAAGFVFFQPLGPGPARLRLIFSKLLVRGIEQFFWCITTDPRLVNAAARFNVLKSRNSTVTEQQLWP